MSEALPIPGLHLVRDDSAIHLWSDAPLAVVSSAMVGGDLKWTRHIVNMHVRSDYDCRNPAGDLDLLARGLGIDEPFVGLMTATRLDRAQVVVEKDEQYTVIAVVTAGLSHPTAAGLEQAITLRPNSGTINMIALVDARLTSAARVNAIITATEAKTLALMTVGVRTPSGEIASGTSTDSIVVASTERGERVEYAGPIMPVGALIGRAVRRAILNMAP